MNRKQFLGNLFMLAAIQAMPKALRDIAPVDEKPGIGNTCFKIKLHRDWFRPGDVLTLDNMQSTFMFKEDDEGPYLHKITDDGNQILRLDVEYFVSLDEKKRMEDVATKIVSSSSFV